MAIKKKKTPEEIAKEQAQIKAGQEFISQREKLAQQRIMAGATPKMAREQASAQIRTKQEDMQAAGISNVQKTAEDVAKEQAIREQQAAAIAMPEPIDISKEKTLTEKTAQLGLQPAAAVGNFIGGKLNKITEPLGLGQAYTPQTAEELAQTTPGKIIGGATAAVGGALAFIGLQNAIAGTGLKAIGLRVSANSILAGGGLLGIFNVSTKLSDAKTIVSNSMTQSKDIIDGVNQGLISPEDAISQFNRIQGNVRSAEASIKIINKDSVKNYIRDGKAAAIEVQYALDDLDIQRQVLINALAMQRAQGIYNGPGNTAAASAPGAANEIAAA